MCLLQRHLKRLLAYSTIAHMGIFLTILGTGSASALGGIAVYVVGHAAVKGALFLFSGVILNKYGSVDEFTLHGRGRDSRVLGVAFLIAGFALAGLPPFAIAFGKGLAENALSNAGLWWVVALMIGVSAATGGAVLRAGGRIFLGLGSRPHGIEAEGMSGDEEQIEVRIGVRRIPNSMRAPALGLLGCGLALGLVPRFGAAAEIAASRFMDRAGYVHAVLGGSTGYAPVADTSVARAGSGSWDLTGILAGLLTALAAAAIAAAALYGRRLPAWARQLAATVNPSLRVLRRAHSGRVGDYVVWMLLGVATGCSILLGGGRIP
jgi:multicomponent Na+:H+ antiporter subunit D